MAWFIGESHFKRQRFRVVYKQKKEPFEEVFKVLVSSLSRTYLDFCDIDNFNYFRINLINQMNFSTEASFL